MNRLLQGDVGSGKTVVAAVALYANFLSGYQGALMVPTGNFGGSACKIAGNGLIICIGIRVVVLNREYEEQSETRELFPAD